MRPRLTEVLAGPGGAPGVNDPVAHVAEINRAFHEATRALEKLQMLCRTHALPGLRPALAQLRLKLGEYLTQTASVPALGSEATAQILRGLLNRLAQDLDEETFETFGSCAVDLGDELASHHRACVRASSP